MCVAATAVIIPKWGGSRFSQRANQRCARRSRSVACLVARPAPGRLSSARTRIERDLDPDAVRSLKETSEADITIGGAELAGQALALGLIDECQLFLGPLLLGGGKRALPDSVRAQLELLDERRFQSGVVHLRSRVSV